jgi:hypothetical protein
MKGIIVSKVKEILRHVPLASNAARQKAISEILVGLIDSRKVQFSEISLHIEKKAKVESTECWIQKFFREFEFDYERVCLALLLFLPSGKLVLSIDRTEWDFGKYQCNVLMIVASKAGVGIPLYWELLDNNSGNSNCKQRIELLEKLVSVIGKERISYIVGDREFIGYEWLKWLTINEIDYCMRVPKHHAVTLKNGESYRIEELLNLKVERFYQGCIVDGVRCNVLLKKLADGDFLFLIGTMYAKELGASYKYRWSIEVLFQSFKKRGFDLEATHLASSKKLSKLLVFVSIAVAICVSIGIQHHKKKVKISTKKHGYKKNSFFRSGLTMLRTVFKRKENNKQAKEILDALITFFDIFIRRISMIVSLNQTFKKILG